MTGTKDGISFPLKVKSTLKKLRTKFENSSGADVEGADNGDLIYSLVWHM